MKARSRFQLVVGVILFGLGAGEVCGDTLTWTAGTNDWHAVQNWTNWAEPAATRVPADGDTAVVTNAGARVLLAQPSAYLGALVISNAVVSCSNWDTTLYATNLTILKGGLLTCEGPFTNNAMSNRVCVTCSTLVIETNGAITVDGKGWAGGTGYYGDGQGPGGGGILSGTGGGGTSGYFFGGSYGGMGRIGNPKQCNLLNQTAYCCLATNTYGSAEAPLHPGSGGTAPHQTVSGYMGGSGGGAVRIVADHVVVNGKISANGTKPVGSSHGSGGSGGGIYITCSTITGTNGSITVNAGPSGGGLGGGGGGGRIAVAYDPEAQGMLPVPSVTFSAAPSSSGGQGTFLPGDIGTLWFPDAYFFSPTNLFTGQWVAPVPPDLVLPEWTVSNMWVRLPSFSLTVTNAVTITGTNYMCCKLEIMNATTVRCGQVKISGATLGLGNGFLDTYPTFRNPFPASAEGATLAVANDLILTNAARLYVFAGGTHAASPSGIGARVEVGNDLLIATNCWVFPVSHPTNGASPLFTMRNLTVGRGGGFNADCFGYAGGKGVYNTAGAMAYGLGAPAAWAAGAGYGGVGFLGYLQGTAGDVYGSADAPIEPGSGAKAATSAYTVGPYGGGSVQIRAGKAVTLLGTITASGGSGEANYGGGASGGGIYITCRTFIGNSNALLQANGGNGAGIPGKSGGGGGGGGRIAVWRVRDFSASVFSNSVSGGLSKLGSDSTTNAAPGTFVLDWLPADGTLMQFQ